MIQKYLFVIGVVAIVFLASLNNRHLSNFKGKTQEDLIQRIAISAINKAPLEKYRDCMKNNNQSVIPKSFVLAILTVENYGRPSFRRWVEEHIAKISLIVLGKLPNYSLGVGQITGQTVKKVLKKTGGHTNKCDDSTILRILLDPCENINVVNTYLSILMDEQNASVIDSLTASNILQIYNGQSCSSFQRKLYQQIVWRVFVYLQRMKNERIDRDSDH